jgi:hypothetical protein
MYRIDNNSSVPALPTIPGAGPEQFFSGGDPTTGQPATTLDAWWVNMIQEEIRNVVVAYGITPNKYDNTQLLQALRRATRLLLTGATTYYISPSGSDVTGDGSSGKPWATLQHAGSWVQGNIDFAGQTVTIQMAHGTYTGGLQLAGSPVGATQQGALIFQGDPADPTACVVDAVGTDCFVANAAASITVQHMTLKCTRSGGWGGYSLGATYGGVIQVQDVIFGPASLAHMYSARNGNIVIAGDYAISGGSLYHVDCGAYGVVELSQEGLPITVTLNGTPNFADAFVGVEAGFVGAPLNTFVGAATGVRFYIAGFGVIDTAGNPAGANYFPGDTPGVMPSPNGGGAYF